MRPALLAALAAVVAACAAPPPPVPAVPPPSQRPGCVGTAVADCILSLAAATRFDADRAAAQLMLRRELDVNGKPAHRARVRRIVSLRHRRGRARQPLSRSGQARLLPVLRKPAQGGGGDRQEGRAARHLQPHDAVLARRRHSLLRGPVQPARHRRVRRLPAGAVGPRHQDRDDPRPRIAAAAEAAMDALGAAIGNVSSSLDLLSQSALRRFRSAMQTMVDIKQISTQQALGLDIQYTAQLYEQLSDRLEAIVRTDGASLEEKQGVMAALMQLEAQYGETAAADQQKLADAARREADRIGRAYEQAFDRLGSGVQRTFNEMLTGQTTWAKGSARLMQEVETFFLDQIET